jgi:hypothetical protein
MLLYSCLFCSTPGLASSQAFANRDDVFLAGFDEIVQSFTVPGHTEDINLNWPAGVPIVQPNGQPFPIQPAELLTKHAERVTSILLDGGSLIEAIESANGDFPPRRLNLATVANGLVRSEVLDMQIVFGPRFQMNTVPNAAPAVQSPWLSKVN